MAFLKRERPAELMQVYVRDRRQTSDADEVVRQWNLEGAKRQKPEESGKVQGGGEERKTTPTTKTDARRKARLDAKPTDGVSGRVRWREV